MGLVSIIKTGYNDLAANAGPTNASALLNGRLAARVTSIANTDPEKGRN